MTIRSLIFATTILAAGTGVAFAQSAVGGPNNSATGARDSVQTPIQRLAEPGIGTRKREVIAIVRDKGLAGASRRGSSCAV